METLCMVAYARLTPPDNKDSKSVGGHRVSGMAG